MKELFQSISKKEWHLVFCLTMVVMLLTGLPYLYGWLSAPANAVYDGLHALSPGDIPVYYSYVNQVAHGDFLVKDLFTGEPQNSGTFNVWWFLVGLFCHWFKLSPILVFQLFRLLLIPVFIFSLYLFLSYFLKQSNQRRLALIFVLFAGGLGAYFSVFFNQPGLAEVVPYRWPTDLWLVESITFSALFQTSHFIASITLTLWLFLLWLLALEKKKISYVVIAGLLALFYFNFHPYYFPVIFGVPGLYLLFLSLRAKKFLWRPAVYLAVIFFISLPSVIYHWWLIKTNAVVGFRALQNVTLISSPLFLIIGLGFLVPGFLLGLFFCWKNKRLQSLTFLLIWLVFNLALTYSALPFQTRYTQGLQLILAIFTALGLIDLGAYLKTRLSPKAFNLWFNNPALWLWLFICFFASTNLYNLTRDIYYFTAKPQGVSEIIYLPRNVLAAITWLENSSPKGSLVLANDLPSKFIAALALRPVYLGHPQETLFPQSKAMAIMWFFNSASGDVARKDFLVQNNIAYLFYSDYEKKLGAFNPQGKNYLKLVYNDSGVQIYQVIK